MIARAFPISARSWRSAALAAAWLLASISSRAGIVEFTASVEQSRVGVGEPVQLIVRLSDDERMPDFAPTIPAVRGMEIVGGPISQSETRIVNGVARFTRTTVIQLMAAAPGAYTVPASRVQVGSRVYETNPITIQVDEIAGHAPPESLRGEPIRPAYTADRDVAQQIAGRFFVRPRITKKKLYVGEPAIVSYTFYRPPESGSYGDSQLNEPDFGDLLVEITHHAARDRTAVELETIDGQTFQKALLFQAIVTPTRAGAQVIEGFVYRFQIPAPGQRRASFLFERMARVDAPGGPIELDVSPLPAAGRPPGFLGTVGSLSLSGSVDRVTMTESDIVTLTLTIEGEGNVELASIPEFPENADFESFGDPVKEAEWTDRAALKGKKEIELLLRPKRTGSLRLPEIVYPIYDPAVNSYRTLTVPAIPVRVQPGSGPSPATPAQDGEGAPPIDIGRRLRYVKGITSFSREWPSPLIENPLYWLPQLSLLGAAGAALFAARRRERLDPAQVRRATAMRRFDKRLGTIKRLQGDPERAAAELERGIREFVGDRSDVSPDGMTSEEIARLLEGSGVGPERAARARQIAETCSQIRYAPMKSASSDIDSWAREAREILSEATRS